MSENNHRVNSKRVPQYVSRSVRIPCKILDLGNDQATVETSDGGQLSISVTQASRQTLEEGKYYEIIARVIDKDTVKMDLAIPMNQDLDMKVVNDAIELTFDPRFTKLFAGE